jgi:hypothetical protein
LLHNSCNSLKIKNKNKQTWNFGSFRLHNCLVLEETSKTLKYQQTQNEDNQAAGGRGKEKKTNKRTA